MNLYKCFTLFSLKFRRNTVWDSEAVAHGR